MYFCRCRFVCKVICQSFPQFMSNSCQLSYVSQFKYLGHIIEDNVCDDGDINGELKSLFARVNVLIRHFCCLLKTSDVAVVLFVLSMLL